MLDKLNNAFSNWDGYEIWYKLSMGVTIACFSVPVLWGTWVYWAEMLNNLPENASFLSSTLFLCTIAAIYTIAVGFLGWIWVYCSFAIGFTISAITLPVIWLYRKLCP